MEDELLEDARLIEECVRPLPPPRSTVALVVVSGLPGSGKSYFCRRLASRYPIARLESDALRKALFGQPTHSPEESRRLFAACHLVLDRLLGAGISALLDATNLREVHRRQLYAIADRHGAKLVLVSLRAPAAVVEERLAARARRSDPADLSDAGAEVYQHMRSLDEPIGRPHIVVDTSADIDPAVEAVLRELEESRR
ncbi:MAG TPA: ATP-binding protein [Dehalococcoidia bacterium]|nr:ATP-binding protein [Dehalococcoidia bacterium]